MKTTNNTTEEKTTNTKKILLKPFPFEEDEKYLLKLKNGEYVIARWSYSKFYLYYNDDIRDEIESIVSLKDLGL